MSIVLFTHGSVSFYLIGINFLFYLVFPVGNLFAFIDRHIDLDEVPILPVESD